jgi:polyisoprenoid-binding protein YceI
VSSIRLGPPSAECRVFTFREGLLASFAHDLELAVTRFDVRIDVEARRADASFDAASLRVLRALRDGVELPDALSDADRRTIEDAVRRDVLEATRFPEIRFRTSRVRDVEDGYDVTGKLALHGKERDVMLPIRRVGDRWVGSVSLAQPDFAIKTYTAFLGAMKVKPDVLVRVSLPVEPPA